MMNKLMKCWCIVNILYITIASNIKFLSHENTSLYFQFFQAVCFIIPVTYFINRKRKNSTGWAKFACYSLIVVLWCIPTIAFFVELLDAI